jgi:hypothetical protein
MPPALTARIAKDRKRAKRREKKNGKKLINGEPSAWNGGWAVPAPDSIVGGNQLDRSRAAVRKAGREEPGHRPLPAHFLISERGLFYLIT